MEDGTRFPETAAFSCNGDAYAFAVILRDRYLAHPPEFAQPVDRIEVADRKGAGFYSVYALAVAPAETIGTVQP